MYYTGFADEAATGIDGQIRATKELGWTTIESRHIDGKNIHDISDEAFDVVCGKLADAGVRINCFGSAIANWRTQITDPFERTLEEVYRAILRMQRLGCDMIRIMSFAVLKDRGPQDQMEDERFRRLRELHRQFTAAGITPVHENCMNYGGMGWTYTLKMIENVPGLKLVFDTGNPIFTDDRTRPEPYPKQSSWEFYSKVKEHIAYVHIKDSIWDPEGKNTRHMHAGEGQGDVKRIVKDLLERGYDGGFSIEPHLAVVHHDPSIQSPDAIKYANYVDYGRRFMQLVTEARGGELV